MTYAEKTTKILALANQEVPLIIFLKRHGYIKNAITLGLFEDHIPSETVAKSEESEYQSLISQFKYSLRNAIDLSLDAILPKQKEKGLFPKTLKPE